VVVLAASLGGLSAIEQVLAPLPADFAAPVVVVQHISPRRPSQFPELLLRRLRLAVRWANEGQRLCPGTVYLAPRDRHLVMTARDVCALSDGPRVHWARPAADPLFESVAEHYGPRALAVVLTGRLSDGAAGALALRRAGGVVIAQDPATCAAPDMPRAVIRLGAADFVLPLTGVSNAMLSLVAVPGTAALFGVAGRGGVAA
jgi:two-component system chemotaxis response regulator CheB